MQKNVEMKLLLTALIAVVCIYQCHAYLSTNLASKRAVLLVNHVATPMFKSKTSALSSSNQPITIPAIPRIDDNNMDTLKRAAAVAGGYTAVRYLKQMDIMKPLEAVAVVSNAASILAPAWGSAAYCGGFAALTSLPMVVNNAPAALIVGATMLSLEAWERLKLLQDYGGRTGAAAACAVGALAVLLSFVVPGVPKLDPSAVVTAAAASVQAVLRCSAGRVELLKGAALAFAAALATLGLRGLLPTLAEPPSAASSSTKASSAGFLNPTTASTSVALVAGKLLSVLKLRTIVTAFGVGNTGVRTYDALAFVLMGTCLGARKAENYNADYVINMALQSLAGALFIFGVTATPLVKVGGMLGVTAVFNTLAVNAVLSALRGVRKTAPLGAVSHTEKQA